MGVADGSMWVGSQQVPWKSSLLGGGGGVEGGGGASPRGAGFD